MIKYKADINAVKSRRGKAIIAKVNGIHDKVSEAARGHRNAIADARGDLNRLKAAASNTQDALRIADIGKQASDKRNEINALKSQLNTLLDDAMPNAAELINDLVRARDEDVRSNAEDIVKQLKIVSSLISEQRERNSIYLQAAETIRNELASDNARDELQGSRLTTIEASLIDSKYNDSYMIIENMISTFLNVC